MIKRYKIKNVRLSDEEFFRMRKEEVLNQWETGKELENLDDCIEGAKEFPDTNYAVQIKNARDRGIHIMQPMMGRALVEFMVDGMTFVEKESPHLPNGAWLIFSDSYTRKCNFKLAKMGIDRSIKEGTTMLNGYPIVNFGVEGAKKIRRASKAGITFNSTDEDGRLASEIALASGWNACNSRSLQEVISHCKDIPLEEMIRINQYESRLCAIYNERGVPTSSEIACNLTGYDAPGFKTFVKVSECLLATEQGVKQINLLHGLTMNVIQDSAMVYVTEKLAKEYLERFGYHGVELVHGTFAFLGAWPPRLEESDAMIAWNTAVSVLSGATNFFIKCQDEAFATPTKEGMAAAVRIASQIDRIMGGQRLPKGPEFELEAKMIELEARALMDKCLEAADGDMAVGLCMGVDAGWISTMISPWKYNKGNVKLMRDNEQAVRYWDCGDVPVPQEVKEYHRAKLEEKAKKLGRPVDLDMIVSDLTFVSRIPITNE